PKAVTTTYGYNNLGNQTSVSVAASGVSPRTTSAIFDAKGRYPTTTTDEMGYTTSTNYNYWGDPLNTTNIQGQQTSYLYDVFGRLTKTTFPEGYSTDVSYNWDISGTQRWYVQTNGANQPTQKTWNDLLGREVRTE